MPSFRVLLLAIAVLISFPVLAHADPILTPILTAAFAQAGITGPVITVLGQGITLASIASAAITTGATYKCTFLRGRK